MISSLCFNDGTFEYVTNIADWTSDNPDIVFAYNGRILAVGKGSTIVRVSISNFTKEIKGNVEGRIDIKKLWDIIQRNGCKPLIFLNLRVLQ